MDPLDPGIGSTGLRWVMLAPVVVAALISAELLYGWRRGERLYDGRETMATLVIALGNRVSKVMLAGIAVLPMLAIFRHRMFDLPMSAWWTWLLLFLGVEFCYYWHHRVMHSVRWFWANHLVHHSATRFNLSAAIRLPWAGTLLGGSLFYWPLVWLGFPPQAVAIMLGLNLAYQFGLHTALPIHLGPLERLLNTPRHHRVHHASNEACLDRNFGGVLILFDRLFGTFAVAPPGEPLRFGLRHGPAIADRPFAVLLLGWREIGRAWRDAVGWRQRLAAVFGRPG